ncbi:MAG: Rne/Rng family ribonuclease [Deltaproteobacteria bacterium]|nr:Rne/Rng family ribonuclease [Deltaproteobacteria bacterium]
MADQIIVNVTPFETRVAFAESGTVLDIFIERNRDRGIVGNLYWGRVQRVLPGMQAAFVEIGGERAAFLYVGDVVPPEEDDDEDTKASETSNDETGTAEGDSDDKAESGEGEFKKDDASDDSEQNAIDAKKAEDAHHRKKRRRRSNRRIEELLKQGQTILVQIAKDSIGSKGPRVTCNISIPGRHLVYMPTHRHLGISRRIVDEDERSRLKKVLEENRPDVGGFVVRTASEGLQEDTVKADIDFLHNTWLDVEKRIKNLPTPNLALPELDIVLRCARDMFNGEVNRFIIDDKATFERVTKFMKLLDPELADRVEFYQGDVPVFDHFGVETELARAMSRRVWLKSGGYLVIDQAEALVAVDVNTGKFVGKRNLEDTILKTNLEAVKEVAYQLRLRNIGGMVIIDFIDMESQDHRDKVLNALTEALKKDRARCNVVKISELGLVEMTRQRVRESLGRQLTEACWYCEGRGVLKSKRTISYEIFRALERQAKVFTEPAVVIHAHPEVVDELYGDESYILEEFEKRTGKEVVVRPRGSFHQEQFDLFGTSLEAVAKETGNKKGKRISQKGSRK